MDSMKWFIGITVIATIGLVALLVWIGTKDQTTQVGERLSDDQWQSITADVAHVQGPEDAPVTIVEFGDFQCPACQLANAPLEQFLSRQEDVRYIWHHFPLSQHQFARTAALAANAAGEQGKFFEMDMLLFEHQSEWTTGSDQESQFVDYAQSLGLNTDEFKQAYEQGSMDAVNADVTLGTTLGINSTPTFFVNQVHLQGIPQSDYAWSQAVHQIQSGSDVGSSS